VSVSAVSVTPRRFDDPPVVLTFDLEEWFCVCGEDFYGDVRRWDGFEKRVEPVTRGVILEELAAGGHRATFFVLGWVAQRYPRLVREIAAAGHEIAFHGMRHRRVAELGLSAFRSELRDGRALLEDLSGAPVAGHRAAEWSITSLRNPALEVLAEEGFRYDASVTPIPVVGRRDNPIFPVDLSFPSGGTLSEFPPLSGRGWGQIVHFGGGWAFRSVAFGRVMRRAEEFRSLGAPAIFTFHPWELDSEHPGMPGLSALLRLALFARARRLPGRFRRLLARQRTHALSELA
jgi:polysaccharide deacetylase family protein (PEP-CTERM system associated)